MKKKKAKNKIIKFISALLIVSILTPAVLFSAPKKADAWMGIGDTTWNIVGDFLSGLVSGSSASTAVSSGASAASNAAQLGIKTREVAKAAGKEVLMAVARRALLKIASSTVNWINNGFHGSPLFVENSQSFFKDIAKSEIRNLVDTFGYDSLRYPFGRDFALNTINSYRSQLATNAAYSLSNVINDPVFLNNYRNNFNVGGWNGFLINTQYPQNNYLGFQMIATNELAARLQGTVQSKAQEVQKTLQYGQGFLSPQTCPSNKDYNNGTNEFVKPSFDEAGYRRDHPYTPPTCDMVTASCAQQLKLYDLMWKANLGVAKEQWGWKNTCPDGLVNTTPGSVVASQITKALGVTQDSTLQAMGVGNAISAVVDALLNHFIDKGLNSLASTVNPPPVADNWTYGTAGGLDSSAASVNWASLPDEQININTFKRQISGADVGTCSNIKDSSGTLLSNQDNISEAECKAESTAGIDIGTCSGLKDSTGTPLAELINIPQSQCDAFTPKGLWTKTSSIAKNTTVWKKTGHAPGDIDNTQTEITLMDNPPCSQSDPKCDAKNPSNPRNTDPNSPGFYIPGIAQTIKSILPQTQALDQCQPGPNKGWENRLKNEQDRVIAKLNGQVGANDELAKKAMNDITKELKFAVDSYKEWVITKMIAPAPQGLGLPESILFIDAVKGIDDFSAKTKELTDARRAKSQTLARLKSIEASLNVSTFATQPKAGSPEEKALIEIKKQYDGMKDSISSTVSISDTENTLNDLTKQLDNLKNLNIKCSAERASSTWGSMSTTTASEKDQFCSTPINSGYSHGKIIRPYDWQNGNNIANAINASGFTFHNLTNPSGNPGYTDLPLVDVPYIWGEISCTGTCSHNLSVGGFDFNFLKSDPEDRRVGVDIDCDTVFDSNITDYTHAGDLAF